MCNGKGFLREYFYEPLEEMYDVQDIFGVFCVSIKYRGGELGSTGPEGSPAVSLLDFLIYYYNFFDNLLSSETEFTNVG